MKRGWVIAVVAAACLVVAVVIFLSISRWGWGWTGLVARTIPKLDDHHVYIPGKTLWDILELLIVPAALALTALWFSNRERKDDREAAEKRVENEHMIATDRQQEAALQAYYDKMTELLLMDKLDASNLGDKVITIARSRTLATLRSLDGTRKGLVIKFLYEAKLIITDTPIIQLDGANLDEVNLSGANLQWVNLSGTSLVRANLSEADLRESILSVSDLRWSDLGKSNLSGSDLRKANLNDAILHQCILCSADLSNNDLSRTNLSGLDLSLANLTSTVLANAVLEHTNLSGADLRFSNLTSTTMKDVNFSTYILPEGKLRKTNLSNADLTYSDLSNCNMIGANLTNAHLEHSNLSNVKLIDTILMFANMTGAKKVTDEQLSKAFSLYRATMPDGKPYNPTIHEEVSRLRIETGYSDITNHELHA